VDGESELVVTDVLVVAVDEVPAPFVASVN
jgi:hypothetical protein